LVARFPTLGTYCKGGIERRCNPIEKYHMDLNGPIRTLDILLKGQLLGKTKWYSREKIGEAFPHLLHRQAFEDQKLPKWGVMIKN
jgi:hypothetical protein